MINQSYKWKIYGFVMSILNSEPDRILRRDVKSRVSMLLLRKLKLGDVSKKESKKEKKERIFVSSNPLQVIINTHSRRKENDEAHKATV